MLDTDSMALAVVLLGNPCPGGRTHLMHMGTGASGDPVVGVAGRTVDAAATAYLAVDSTYLAEVLLA